jgi:hypothetical protein
MGSAARKSKQTSPRSPEPVAHLTAVTDKMYALLVARAGASLMRRGTTPLFGRARENSDANTSYQLQVWKLIDEYFEGAKTYTLTIGPAQVSLAVDARCMFEVPPHEAAKVPLYSVAKRIR